MLHWSVMIHAEFLGQQSINLNDLFQWCTYSYWILVMQYFETIKGVEITSIKIYITIMLQIRLQSKR